MGHYREPGQPGFYRYEVNRYPYVEVDHAGELFHAHACGWNDDTVMIAKPKGQLQRVDNCARETIWVPATACTRIRRADSTWITTEDDHDWHEIQDQTIDYRPRVSHD